MMPDGPEDVLAVMGEAQGIPHRCLRRAGQAGDLGDVQVTDALADHLEGDDGQDGLSADGVLAGDEGGDRAFLRHLPAQPDLRRCLSDRRTALPACLQVLAAFRYRLDGQRSLQVTQEAVAPCVPHLSLDDVENGPWSRLDVSEYVHALLLSPGQATTAVNRADSR